MESLIETAKEFTKKSKDFAMISGNDKEEIIIDSSIKWENSNHFIALFLDEGEFISLYRNATIVPQNIKKLILSQFID